MHKEKTKSEWSIDDYYDYAFYPKLPDTLPVKTQRVWRYCLSEIYGDNKG